MRSLQRLVREHNREHSREYRLCFKVVYENCYIWPVNRDTIYYGEIIADFVHEYQLNFLIMPDEKYGVRIMIY